MTPRRAAAPPPAWVLLVRGVNVGGKKLAMADLRAAVADAGGEHVSTYIQSGNALCTSARAEAELVAAVEAAIEARTGLGVAVLARTADELAAVVAANPFPRVADPTKLVVTFLGQPPPAGALEALDLGQHAPEELVAVGRELYLHLPGGQARAKLPLALTAKALGGVGTTRNWRSVGKLLELAKDTEAAAATS